MQAREVLGSEGLCPWFNSLDAVWKFFLSCILCWLCFASVPCGLPLVGGGEQGSSQPSVLVLHCRGFFLLWSSSSSCAGFCGSAQGSALLGQQLSCPEACGMFPGQGWSPYPLHCQGRFLTTGPLGKPCLEFLSLLQWEAAEEPWVK